MNTQTIRLTFVVADPALVESAGLANDVCIAVAQLCGLPVKQIKVLERVGRVVLVDYTCHAGTDPIMPVVLAQMPAGYQEAWRAMAMRVERWSPHWQYSGEQREWYSRTSAVLGRLMIEINRATGLLNPAELDYLRYQLRLCAASPNRKHQERPEFYG